MKIREYLIEQGKTYTVPRTQKGEKLIIYIDGEKVDTPIVNYKITGIVGVLLTIFTYEKPHELEIIRSYTDKEKELREYKNFINKMAKSEDIINQAYHAVENKKQILTVIDNAIENFKKERDNWQGKARSHYSDLESKRKEFENNIDTWLETLSDKKKDTSLDIDDGIKSLNNKLLSVKEEIAKAHRLKHEIDREKQEIEQIKKDIGILSDKVETQNKILSQRGENALTLFKQQKEALNRTLTDVTKEFTQIATKRKVELQEPLERVTLIDRRTGRHHTLEIVDGVLDIE